MNLPPRPDEVEIQPDVRLVDGEVVSGPHRKRIDWLVDNYLIFITHDESGWLTLYRDPLDGRLWERIYPESGYHGGGSPMLQVITKEDAAKKYPKIE